MGTRFWIFYLVCSLFLCVIPSTRWQGLSSTLYSVGIQIQCRQNWNLWSCVTGLVSRNKAYSVIRVCAWDNLKERRVIPLLFVQRFQFRISSSRCLSTTPWQEGPAGVTGTQRQGKIRISFPTSLSKVYTNTHCLLLGLTSLGLHHHRMVSHGLGT